MEVSNPLEKEFKELVKCSEDIYNGLAKDLLPSPQEREKNCLHPQEGSSGSSPGAGLLRQFRGELKDRKVLKNNKQRKKNKTQKIKCKK